VLVLAFAAGACAAEISVADLPPEARQTLALIRAGGPFSHARDGAPFGNREGLLPERVTGYYREYTVPTPGARDRGARRIVAGRGGEYYYTHDHYRTFRRIRE
jgi:ribonuclease T1